MNPCDFYVVETTSADIESIRQIHCDAFGYDKEARLTEQLLGDPTAEPRVSLLAFHSRKPVGHILFTRASFRGTDEPGMIHILAPLAVVREYQRQGVGGVLIREGLKRLKAMGSLAVFVLGHKEYYPKYGFKPYAARRGFATPYRCLMNWANTGCTSSCLLRRRHWKEYPFNALIRSTGPGIGGTMRMTIDFLMARG